MNDFFQQLHHILKIYTLRQKFKTVFSPKPML